MLIYTTSKYYCYCHYYCCVTNFSKNKCNTRAISDVRDNNIIILFKDMLLELSYALPLILHFYNYCCANQCKQERGGKLLIKRDTDYYIMHVANK